MHHPWLFVMAFGSDRVPPLPLEAHQPTGDAKLDKAILEARAIPNPFAQNPFDSVMRSCEAFTTSS
jgi:hypothetical protein